MLALAGAQTKVMKRSTQLVRPLKSDASSTTMPDLEKVTQIPQPGQEKRNQLSDLRRVALCYLEQCGSPAWEERKDIRRGTQWPVQVAI
jgi:hypothetical protein